MRICEVAECGRKHRARGLCYLHWDRMRKHGTTELPTIEDRFWQKVTKSDGCWEYGGYRDFNGYGQVNITRGLRKTTQKAHRFAYEHVVGPIPEGYELDHVCHNPGCVKPDHMRLSTHKQNLENRLGVRSDSASGVRGVVWDRRRNKWVAYARHHGKQHHGGYFDDLEEAGKAAAELRNRLFTHNDSDRKAA